MPKTESDSDDPSRTSTSSLPVSRRQVEGVDPLRLAELERLQFSCELHDGLLQYLVGAKLATEALRGQLQASQITSFSSQLAAMEEMLTKGIREGRQWIGQLRGYEDLPANDLETLLGAAIQMVREAFSSATIYSDLDPEALAAQFSASTRTAIYRVAMEALRNAARHSKAESISITVSMMDTPFPWTLEVRDDGVGFDPNQTPKGHFGLAGMKTRAELIGAQLEIRSARNEGTLVRFSLKVE